MPARFRPIDKKIAIRRNHRCPAMVVGEMDKARIGKVHRHIAVFSEEVVDGSHVIKEAEVDLHYA